MNSRLPKKLKSDAILEAVCQISFEPEPSIVPDFLFGQFADFPDWKEFKKARLPTADIPAQIRRADSNLRYQPSVELVSPDGAVSVRIGPQTIIYARRGQYPGWDQFGTELKMVISNLFSVIPSVQVSRIGLRYINALRSDAHEIRSVDDIDIEISVANGKLNKNLNLNFKTRVGTNFETMSRVASIDMAEGNIPENATVVVDIDVYTGQEFSVQDADSVEAWIAEAHDKEKESFFSVLGTEATQRLRED